MDRKSLEVLCLTWNVGESKPEGSPFFRWVAERARSAAVVVICLQEIEMGSSSIVLGAAKDALLKSAQARSAWPSGLGFEIVQQDRAWGLVVHCICGLLTLCTLMRVTRLPAAYLLPGRRALRGTAAASRPCHLLAQRAAALCAG